MAKQHPGARESEKDIKISRKELEEFVEEDIVSAVSKDINSRTNFHHKLAEWYRRRYQIEESKPVFPFENSSDFIPPLIDMEIDKRKPAYMNLLESDPIVTFVPLNAAAKERADAAEQTMQYLLTTRMRDFFDNVEMGVDSMLQNGYNTFKVIYEYKTQVVTEIIRASEFDPQDIEDIRQNAEAISQAAAEVSPEELEQVQLEFQDQLEAFVRQRFGLDLQDELDDKAASQIIDFILEEDKQEELVIKRNEVIHDAPYVYPVDPLFLIPQKGARNIQDSERLTEIKFMTENDIRIRGKDGYFDKKAVKDLMDKMEAVSQEDASTGSTRLQTELQTEKANREGVNFGESDFEDMIEIWEVYTMYDIDGDGVKEKVLMTIQPEHKVVLKFMEFPYEHGKWPFVKADNEKTEDRFEAPRGIPEILDQTDLEIRFNHRAKANHNMISNAPTFKYRIGSGINPNNWQWIPGQMMPVLQMNDIEPMLVPSRDSSYDNEENILRTWVEGRLGSTDFALTRQGPSSEPRTRAEIEAVVALGQQSLSIGLKRFQRAMSEVYSMVWDLWLQYGPEEFMIPFSSGMVRPMSRFEIQGTFEIVPVGTIGNSNPQQLAAQAQQVFQFVAGLKAQGAEEMMNYEYEINIADGIKEVLNKTDFVGARRLLRKREPQEVQALQQQAAQRQQMIAAAESNQGLTVEEMRELKKSMPFKGNQKVAS